MKKSLILLPLLAGLSLAACEFTAPWAKKDNTNQSGNGSGNGNGGNGGGGGDTTGGGGGGINVSGTPVATITMSKCQDMTSEGVFSKNGYTVTVEQNTCAQTVAEAVTASQTYEFRVYAHMNLTFSGSSAFSKLLIKYSNYVSNGKTYYFDYEELEGATNEFDNSSCQALVTLDSASTSFTVECWHQTRIASVAFYA